MLFFDLDNQNRTKEFHFRQVNSFISIKKIIITSLSGAPNVWSPILATLNPIIGITCTGLSGNTYGDIIVINSYISPYHYNPVIDIPYGIVIPESNVISPSGSVSILADAIYNRAVLSLSFTDMDSAGATNLQIRFFYERTQGVFE